MAGERHFVAGDRRYRRLPKIDPCKVDIRKLKNLSQRALMNIWVRLGASHPSRLTTHSLLKGIVSNYAAAKSSAETYKRGDPQRAHAMRVYVGITRRLVKEFEALRSNSCPVGPRGGVRRRR